MANEQNTAVVPGQVVEVDTRNDDDTDSAYQDEIESYTASLTSSIRNHTYENGRRYHSFRSGRYLAPNDEAENDRLDMHHRLATLLIDGKLHAAPIGKNPQAILDVGCGTGIWTIDIGDEYPSAEVIGVDLSPTQPTMVPPNVQFEIDDVEEEWTYRQSFDLVHVRFLAAAIQDWPKLVQQTYKHAKPGGWCEFKDWDLNVISKDSSLLEDSYIVRYHKLVFDALSKVGRDHEPGPKLKGWVERAGFQKVEERVLPVPIGFWPRDPKFKEVGFWNLMCLKEGLEAIALRLFTSVLGWKQDEVQVLLAHVRTELNNRRIHAQYTYYVVYGQKPMGKEGD